MTENAYHFLDNIQTQNGTTRFWMIRHAIVNKADRAYLYGTNNVAICLEHVKQQASHYRYLATRLPQTEHWFTTHLSRTKDTALNIQQAGYGHTNLTIEEAFLEQHLGAWQGLPHDVAAQHLQNPTHPFWPLSAKERPPHGESMEDVTLRVGNKMEQLSQDYSGQDLIIVSHGGAIRASLAHALHIPTAAALSFSIYNLSLTLIEKHKENWRVITVNELSDL